MANYAYVKNNSIDSVYDFLPKNWQNISNFNLLNDWTYYNYLGWQQIVKDIPVYNPATQKIDFDKHVLIGGIVHEQYKVIDLPIPPISQPYIQSLDDIKAQVRSEVQAALDAFAQTRGYVNIADCCSYILEPNHSSHFYIEGQYCVQLRTNTFTTFDQIFTDIKNGVRAIAYHYSDILPDLPIMQWPN